MEPTTVKVIDRRPVEQPRPVGPVSYEIELNCGVISIREGTGAEIEIDGWNLSIPVFVYDHTQLVDIAQRFADLLADVTA